MDKESVLHTYNQILLNYKKKETLYVSTWMSLVDITLSKISQAQKESIVTA